MDEYQIVQIIPAGGWHAEFGSEPDQPLVCWALIKYLHGGQAIVGMIGEDETEVSLVIEDDDFEGYVHADGE